MNDNHPTATVTSIISKMGARQSTKRSKKPSTIAPDSVLRYWKQRQLLQFRALQPLLRSMEPSSLDRHRYPSRFDVNDRISYETEGIDRSIFVDREHDYYGRWITRTYSPSGRWILIGHHNGHNGDSNYQVFTVADISDPTLQLPCTLDVYNQQQHNGRSINSSGSNSKSGKGSDHSDGIAAGIDDELTTRVMSTCHTSWDKLQQIYPLAASNAHRKHLRRLLDGLKNDVPSLSSSSTDIIKYEEEGYGHSSPALLPTNIPVWCWGSRSAHWSWLSSAPSTLAIMERPPLPCTESQREIDWCARQPTRPPYYQVLPSRDTDRQIWIDSIASATESVFFRELVDMIFEYLDG
jgi:hypothetical protein